MTSALLLAEPESATRGFLERHLRQDGFEVLEAVDGEAFALAELSRPDLVLASDSLALELCRRVSDVPVIVLGRPDSDAVDRVRAFAGGCDDYSRGRSTTRSCWRGSVRSSAVSPRRSATTSRWGSSGSTAPQRVLVAEYRSCSPRSTTPRQAGRRPRACSRGGTARGLGLPLARPHADAGLPRVPPAALSAREAVTSSKRVGVGYSLLNDSV